MQHIENIKTGLKYQVSEKAFSKIMKNKSLRSLYIVHPQPEVPEEVKKAKEIAQKQTEVVSEVVRDIPKEEVEQELPIELEEKPKKSRKKKQDDEEETQN